MTNARLTHLKIFSYRRLRTAVGQERTYRSCSRGDQKFSVCLVRLRGIPGHDLPFVEHLVTGSVMRIAACRGSPRDRPLTLCGRRQAKKNPSTIGEVFNAVSEGTTPIFSYAA